MDIITIDHLEKCAKMTLLSGIVVSFFYCLEFFFAWYGDELMEKTVFMHRMFGFKAWAFWLMILCNMLTVQLLWVKKLRQHEKTLIFISVFILVGMWMERYVIVVTSLMDSYLPAMRGKYQGTKWDWALYLGSFGLFFTGLLVVLRFLPFIPISEVKEGERHESV